MVQPPTASCTAYPIYLIGNHLSMISFISKWRRNSSKIKFCGIKMMKNSIKNQCIIILNDDYNPITSNQVFFPFFCKKIKRLAHSKKDVISYLIYFARN